MSAPTQLIQKTLSNSSFLGFKLKSQIKSVNEDQVLSNAALVITKCQEFLALTNNTHLPPLLDAVIDNTARLVQLLQDQRVNKTTRHAKEIAALCKQLETQSLKLPTNMHPPKTLSSTSYNIAVVCFYCNRCLLRCLVLRVPCNRLFYRRASYNTLNRRHSRHVPRTFIFWALFFS